MTLTIQWIEKPEWRQPAIFSTSSSEMSSSPSRRAKTSTVDKNEGFLVDVFNRAGKYLDNFWLPYFRIRTEGHLTYYTPMAILDDFLFVIEITEGDLISVVKYKIVDG